MLPHFADIFQQGYRWLNWLEKQPEGSVRPVVIEPVTKLNRQREYRWLRHRPEHILSKFSYWLLKDYFPGD